LEKINNAKKLGDLKQLLLEIRKYKVLDPACGSGNFLYIAYRELKRLEMEILTRIHAEFPGGARDIGTGSLVSLQQFYGIDLNTFAVELARVTMLLAKEIAIIETQNWLRNTQLGFDAMMEQALPLDNLDDNIIIADALFMDWPEVDVIIGNPPFQSKTKMRKEYGGAYLNLLWEAYPEVPGRADYCVYWFYKSHQVMKLNSRAGLVGTNTIRQNYSREGGLDIIVSSEGTIFSAVSTQLWSGDADVSVSIVNWVKGSFDNKKELSYYPEKGEPKKYVLDFINSSLSFSVDVAGAEVLNVNKIPKTVFQGQTHGHEGFLIDKSTAQTLLKTNPDYDAVLKPFLIGNELLSNYNSQPDRFVIDFTKLDLFQASYYKDVFEIVKIEVLPTREKKAVIQENKNSELLKRNNKARINKHHINFFKQWWKLSYGRKEMLEVLEGTSKYICCSRVTLRPIFEFVSAEIHPNDRLLVFAFQDNYSFGIIHSNIHWLWIKEKSGTVGERFNYTPNTVWDTFPFPQSPTIGQVRAIAIAALTLRSERNRIMEQYTYSLRDLYRLVEQPGSNPIKALHKNLDDAVCEAYGFDPTADILQQLLDLNHEVAAREQAGESVTAPGLPPIVEDPAEFISDDCVRFETNDIL